MGNRFAVSSFKVIVAGSRGINNYQLIKEKLDIILKNVEEDIEIVSGGARGVDLLGERYAEEKGHTIKQFIPDWDNLGKSAGYIRNAEMAVYADACVVFWDGKSRGSKNMYDTAKKKGLKARLII